MAELSIGAAVGEGFVLIRRRPISILLWGLVSLAITAGIFGVLAPFYTSIFTRAFTAAKLGAVAPPPNIRQMMQMQGMSYLTNFVSLAVSTVLYCAAFRSVIHPDQNQFGYLRVGLAELFVFILKVAAAFGFVIVLIIVAIPVGIIVGVLVAMHLLPVAIILGVVLAIAAAVGAIYVALRFSLIAPMIVSDGKFHLFDAWALTKGKTGGLFLMALCLFVIVVIAESVIGLIMLLLGAGVLGGMAGGFQNLPMFFRQPPQILFQSLTPILALAGLLWIPISGAAVAVMGAPWARAYRDLAGPDLAATFA